MQLRAAIITVKQITLAVILVEPEETYPEPAERLIKSAQLIFQTLPIMLISRRVKGFSRSYAPFDIDRIVSELNADTICWQHYTYRPTEEEPPF